MNLISKKDAKYFVQLALRNSSSVENDSGRLEMRRAVELNE